MLLASERRWAFATPPLELWSLISRVDDYPSWWPWLRAFDGEHLQGGAVWHCGVKPPLPYVVEFTMTIDDIVPMESVAASLSGDITGTARINIAESHEGSQVRLRAELAPAKRWLGTLSWAARPIVRFGHNWVLDTAARQFAARAEAPDPLR